MWACCLLVAALAPRPFCSNAPLHDEIFAKTGTDDCMRDALPIGALLHADGRLISVNPDCGHGFPMEQRMAAYRFLDQHLQPHPPSARPVGR